jgi:PAS domain S-box-containing protein
MLSGQAGLIALRNGDDLQVRAMYNIHRSALEHFGPLVAATTFRPDGGLNIPALDEKIKMLARTIDLGLHQMVALPMAVGGEPVGVIYIFRSQGIGFSRNDRVVLQSFADQAAIAVHNARLYERAERERERFEAILEYTADGVMILTPTLQIESFNRALSKITGWSAEQAVGRDHDAIIAWHCREPGIDLKEAVAGGWPVRRSADAPVNTLYVEGDIQRPDGTTISAGITYAPLIDSSGRLVNVIANVRDITHFRKAQEMTSTFISVISHELKTPVSLIKGYASTLRRKDAAWSPETVQTSLEVIEEEADRLTNLIDNLLQVSRLQAGIFEVDMGGHVALDRLAARVAQDFRTQTAKHQIVVDFPDGFPAVPGDEVKLRHVLDNLVNNAIKYAPDGGEVRISGEICPDELRVSVKDQGMGLPQDELERVFSRFYRVDDALTRKTQGTGLGLYLADAIIKAHGGRIWAEGKPGEGAVFTFALPRE